MTRRHPTRYTMSSQITPVPNPVESYWLSERHELAKVRTTPNLPLEADIVIMGSGMAGIATAYHILKDNPHPPNLVILEAREICQGATGRNGGHSKVKIASLASAISREGPGRLSAAETDVLHANVQTTLVALKKIVEEEELDCEFELRRSYDVFFDVDEAEKLKAFYNKSREEGRKWTDYVSYIDSRYVEHITAMKGAKAAFCVPAASLWPYKFVTQLLARLLKRYPETLNVQTTTPVTSITRSEAGKNLIHTERGIIEASKLVFATNAYTAGLLPDFAETIVPYKGMASHIVPKRPIHPHLANTYNIHFSPENVDYFNPRPDGSIVVGGGNFLYREKKELWYGNWDDSVMFPSEAHRYWDEYMQRNFQGWEHSKAYVERSWVGIQAATTDQWPHVGMVPGCNDRWMLAGFNGGGMAIIPISSIVVAEMVKSGRAFDEVAKERGVPLWFGASKERLRRYSE
jgi:glycine/D-amino acid oxidase-like deaminating enzyme